MGQVYSLVLHGQRQSDAVSPLNTLTPSETRPLGLSGAPDRGQGTDLAKQTLHDRGATLRIAGTTGQLPLVSVVLEPTQAYRTAMEERRREASCTHSLREVMIRRKAWEGPHRPTVCSGKGQGTLDPSRDQGKGLPCLQTPSRALRDTESGEERVHRRQPAQLESWCCHCSGVTGGKCLFGSMLPFPSIKKRQRKLFRY